MTKANDITSPETAKKFLSDWTGQMRRGILGAAIDGAMASFRVMRGNLSAYGADATCDQREAATVLKLAYRQTFGTEYGAR